MSADTANICSNCGVQDCEGYEDCTIRALIKERDEARAEVERLRQAKHTNGCRQQSAYNAECVCGADEAQRDLLRTVAERQRELCKAEAYFYARLGCDADKLAEKVGSVPLVTEKSGQ